MYHVKTLAHMLIVWCLHYYIPHDAQELYFFKNQHDVIMAVDNIVARINSVDIICCIHIYIFFQIYSYYPIIQRGGRAITIIYIYRNETNQLDGWALDNRYKRDAHLG